MERIILLFSFCLLSILSLKSQQAEEVTHANYIKSVVFTNNSSYQFPIVQKNEEFVLEFDDTRGNQEVFYYKISYFNADWTPTTLFKQQYLEGFDDLRISDFRNSFNTLKPYTHYTLTLPNENIKFKVSGNYMAEIYDSNDELVFSRKFIVYEPKSTIQLGIYRSRSLEKYTTDQNLQFTITLNAQSIYNPRNEVKVFLLQNFQWDSVIEAPPPQFIVNNRLEYRYTTETEFEGGNAYYFFDTKNIRTLSANIVFVGRKYQLFNTFLKTDIERNGYPFTYSPDIYGNYFIQSVNSSTPSLEADYSEVHFKLGRALTLANQRIFVYGKFNNYELSTENEMIFNPQTELFEAKILLKQGVYNYKYVVWTPEKGIEKNQISGTHAQTDNLYLILVYQREFGKEYDSLIGFQTASSLNLLN